MRKMKTNAHATNDARKDLTATGRFFVALSAKITGICDVLALLLGLAALGLTALGFVQQSAGSASLTTTAAWMIGALALLILLDFVPSLVKTIAGRWSQGETIPPTPDETHEPQRAA